MLPKILWIDHEQVRIYEVGKDESKKTRLFERHVDHHTHSFDNLDKDHQARAFFDRIATLLMGGSKILVIGPGVQKLHFCQYLRDRFAEIAKDVVGCETVDHPTDNQIVAMARKFFENDL